MSAQTKSSAVTALLVAVALAGSCTEGATDRREADNQGSEGGRGGGGTGGHGGARDTTADAGIDVSGGEPADAGASPADALPTMSDTAKLLDGAPAALDSTSNDLALSDAPSPDAPALDPCSGPAVDRLEIWEAHGGNLKPAVGGNLLVKDGDRYYAKVDFLPGGEWHEIVVPIVNSLAKKVDLTKSKGFWLTYSATADLWVQLRPLSHAHGGEQYTAKLPSTAGLLQEVFISFAPAAWGMLLGTPPFPYDQALRDANFFNFIGPPGTANAVTINGLRIDGHVPPCS
jgi:hypothetical protein